MISGLKEALEQEVCMFSLSAVILTSNRLREVTELTANRKSQPAVVLRCSVDQR